MSEEKDGKAAPEVVVITPGPDIKIYREGYTPVTEPTDPVPPQGGSGTESPPDSGDDSSGSEESAD
jgi:hypothetical protein